MNITICKNITIKNYHTVRKDDPIGADIIDEALYYFKANIFFSSYEIKVSLLA